ncbi:hypothetical protein, partial [Bacillus atrophaeus]|uniref:hypothetical protein n=1 Tax=Bacillus atrophaeus TaxID=1452 RepID=UPI002DBC07E9
FIAKFSMSPNILLSFRYEKAFSIKHRCTNHLVFSQPNHMKFYLSLKNPKYEKRIQRLTHCEKAHLKNDFFIGNSYKKVSQV